MGKVEDREGDMRDDTAHGKVQAKYGESSKAGLPMEGTPLTTDKDGKLTPMPSYRTDIGKGTWYHAGKKTLLSTTNLLCCFTFVPLTSPIFSLL